jgi:hypothetical protein
MNAQEVKPPSENARMLFFYRVCGWTLLSAVFLLIVLNLLVLAKGAASVTALPGVLIAPIGIIGAAGALACMVLWPSMMWHCLVVSKASTTQKALWFALLLFTVPLGTVIYYFVEIEAER